MGVVAYAFLIWESGAAAFGLIAAVWLVGGAWYRFGVKRA